MLERLIRYWSGMEPSQFRLKRGFGSSTDEYPCYVVLWDGRVYSYQLVCSCGGVYELEPVERQSHHHVCGGLDWNAELELER